MKQKNQKQPARQINKKMIQRLIIIHNAIKAGLYPDNKKLRRLYLEETGYSNVGEATINREFVKNAAEQFDSVWMHLRVSANVNNFLSCKRA